MHGHSLVPRDMIKQALYLMGKFFVILLFLYGVCRLVLDNYVGVEEFKTLSIHMEPKLSRETGNIISPFNIVVESVSL